MLRISWNDRSNACREENVAGEWCRWDPVGEAVVCRMGEGRLPRTGIRVVSMREEKIYEQMVVDDCQGRSWRLRVDCSSCGIWQRGVGGIDLFDHADILVLGDDEKPPGWDGAVGI